MAATEAKRQSNRWQALLDSAAAKFAEQGYHATTIRELAAATAMTPGAIYFHVPNKQALLLAVYEEGVQRILDRIEAAVEEPKAPWDRLESAVAAHLESILDAGAYARVIIRILPADVPEITSELTKLRDRYEARFRALFSEIDLPRDRDPKLARLFILGAINWTPVWYRPRGLSIRALARELLAPLRALAERESVKGSPVTTSRLDPPARVLVTKIGLDGHDRGSRIVAAFLRDAGMDVIYTPPWQSIAAVVKLASEEDVDAIGVSSLATDHLIVPDLIEALRAAGLGHIAVVVGGIVPDDERPALLRAGVSAIFGPGASRDEIVEHVARITATSRRERDADLWESVR